MNATTQLFTANGDCANDPKNTPGPQLRFWQATDGVVRAARILIIDDERAICSLIQKHLRDANFDNLQPLNNSATALECIWETSPDLVLLDLNMPDVGGLRILEAMRHDHRTQSTPVVILTAATDSDSKLQALKLGATDFLSKPVDPSELVLRVGNVLAAKARLDDVANYSSLLERKIQDLTARVGN